MIKETACVLFFFCCVLSAAEEQWAVSSRGMDVPFRSWQAEGTKASTNVLVLVPGYNGKGEQMLDVRWKTFAANHCLVLLAPTFHAEGNENNNGKGYYYPEQGSGEVMEKALAEVQRRTGVKTEKVLFFGFSAGAHYVHRFALWKPQRVKAFVAYSAGWWSEPGPGLKSVPALIMCGETDERYQPTLEFFRMGRKLGCPWIWRSYENTGHNLTPAVRDMAEAFLEYYSGREAGGAAGVGKSMPVPRERWYGDLQTFKSVGEAGKGTIPEEFRIELPSKKVAEVWEKESK